MAELVQLTGPHFAGQHAVFINPAFVTAVVNYQDDYEVLSQVSVNSSAFPILVAGNSTQVSLALGRSAPRANTRHRDLVKAAALLIAEIERFDRNLNTD